MSQPFKVWKKKQRKKENNAGNYLLLHDLSVIMIIVTQCTELWDEKVISSVIRRSIFLYIGKFYKLKEI